MVGFKRYCSVFVSSDHLNQDRFIASLIYQLFLFLQAFNQEQHALVMTSLQQGLVPKKHLDGIDNPALDISGTYASSASSNFNSHHQIYGTSGPTRPITTQNSSTPSNSGAGGKMAGYTFSDQSLSLSSSNADSIDTVIYKGYVIISKSIPYKVQQFLFVNHE